MNQVFVSYVRENTEIVDKFCQELKSHGIQVWRDRDNIAPGSRWKQEIRNAIREGTFFVACFSKEYDDREKTYMNEELAIAIEELRQHPHDRIWFIPVKLNDCEIPDRDVGGGETLRDLHYVNLYEDWDDGIERIRRVIQSESEITCNGHAASKRIDKNVYTEFTKGLEFQNSVGEIDTSGEKREKIEKAIQHYTRALELKPDYFDARNARGASYAMTGMVDLAIKDLSMVIKLKPDYFAAYLNRGGVNMSDGRYHQALRDFGRVIELQPKVYAGYSRRAEVYRLRGDFDRAIADYNRAIQLKPELAELYNNRAIAYVNKGDLERAILDYSEAIELQAHFSAAYFNRGVAHLRLKEWIKAKVDMTNASKMGVNIVTAFRIDYANVEDFEKRTGTKLPPDIAAMLAPPQT